MDWSPHQQQSTSDESRGATPVVGTVLLIGVVVVISATVGVTVMDYPSEVESTSVAVDDNQCQAVEFDPQDVAGFADDRSDCAGGAAAGGPYQGAVMWFDASQEGFSSGGESVDSWSDRSGNGYDAVVSRGDPQGYADIDGVPAVEFESNMPSPGGDSLSPGATAAEADIDGDSRVTVSTVIRSEERIPPSYGSYFSVGDYSEGTFMGQVVSLPGASTNWITVSRTENEDGDMVEETTTSVDPNTEPWTVITYVYDRTAVSLYVNGDLQDESEYDDLEVDLHGEIVIGGSEGGSLNEFDGAIAEFVVYDRPLDDDQRERLECGYDDKYGSAVSVTGC